MAETYYQVLGVGIRATPEEIRLAYKRLARQYHPDVNAGSKTAEEQFKRVAEAYQTLSDQRKRDLYDVKLYYSAVRGSSSFSGGVGRPPSAKPTSRYEQERAEYHRRRPEREAYRRYTGPPISKRVTLQSTAVTLLVAGTLAMLALWFGDVMNHWTAKDHLSRGDYETALAFDDSYGEAYFMRYKTRKYYGANPKILLLDLNLAIRFTDEPDDEMFAERAKVFFRLDSLDRCESDFLFARKLNPKNDTTAYALADLYAYYLKLPQKAMHYYDTTIRLNPKSIDAQFGKGFMLYRLKQFGPAIQQFNLCFRLEPNDRRVFFYRGSARLVLGDSAGACSDLDQSLTMGMVEAKPIVDRFCAGR